MSKNDAVTVDLDRLEDFLTTSEVAEEFDVSTGYVRREAKKGNVPGFVDILGRYAFDPDQIENWEPTPGRRGRSTRADNRLRFKIYLTRDEADELSEVYDIVDPRKKAAERRAARKAKEANEVSGEQTPETEAGGNPFDSFS